MDRLSANLLSVAAAALALGGCADGSADRPNSAAKREAEANGAGYQAPLRAASATAAADGGVVLRGEARPEARVRALTAGGAAYGATAGEDGAFVIELPRSPEPRLVALSAEEGERSVQTEGWLFLPPERPDAAVMLRPGAPAAPLAGAGVIAAVDYDGAGAAAIAGRVGPSAPVRVTVDGVAAGRATADPQGLYGVRLYGVRPGGAVGPGEHVVRVETDTIAVERRVRFESRTPGGVFAADREAAGWRVDWKPLGGGVQSTFVLVEPQARPKA